MKGAPDIIIEVWSKSTGSIDLGDKRYDYQDSGVKEYWVIKDIRTVHQYILDERNIYQETLHNSFNGEDIEIPVKIWDGRLTIRLGSFVHSLGDTAP